MRNVWTFGCSFSSGYLHVGKEKTYSHLISKELNLNDMNFASPGYCNDKIFNTLTTNINDINVGDVVIYQFSFFNRIGVFKDKYNIHTYISSAGLPEFGIEYKSKEESYSGLSYEEISSLLDFTIMWNERRFLFTYINPVEILNFLKKTKNTRNFLIFLENNEQFSKEDIIDFPVEGNENNLSWTDYLEQKKLTVENEYPEKYSYDGHPGLSGHEDLKNKIITKLQYE